MSYAFRAEVKAMAINTKNMTTGGVGNGSVPVTATAMMDPTIHAAAPTKPYNTFLASTPVNSRHDRRMIAMPIAEEPITRRSNRAISLARPSRSTKSLSLIKSGKNANTSPTNMRTEGMMVRAVFDFIRKACSKVKFQFQRCFKGGFISFAKRRLQSKAI